MSYTLFDKPMTPAEIHEALYSKVQPYNMISAVLQQELIVYCGKLIASDAELFDGILVVRMGYVGSLIIRVSLPTFTHVAVVFSGGS